jgi:hypothetical protein
MQMCRHGDTIVQETDSAIWIGGAASMMFVLGAIDNASHPVSATPAVTAAFDACSSGKFISYSAMQQAFENWAKKAP